MDLDRIFHLKENHTDVKTEVMAGVTSFMTMAYILAVNPNILSAAGMDHGAVFSATAIASFLGTLCMALFANYPFALAPGMGLNAYFAYTVVLGMGYSWQVALAAVLAEGLIFILLSLFNIREAIFNAIPFNLKKAVSVGIGLFIAFIGLQNAKIVIGGSTLVGLFSRLRAATRRSTSLGIIFMAGFPSASISLFHVCNFFRSSRIMYGRPLLSRSFRAWLVKSSILSLRTDVRLFSAA
jgi:xanthine/uracil/vitamin C permease (AzgA family)